MAEYDDKNRGALFRNDKEGGSESWPDFNGSLNVNGVDYWISGWKKISKKGAAFMSLSVVPKQKPRSDPARQEPQGQAGQPFDDEIPFLPDR